MRALLAAAIACLSGLPVQNAVAQASWQEIFDRDEPPVPPENGGSRGDFCAIAPSVLGEIREIWNERPLLLWQGFAARMEVRSRDAQEVLWQAAIKPSDRSIFYQGKPLQPSQIYDWVIFEDESKIPSLIIPFRVMEREKRDRIAKQLAELEAPLREAQHSGESRGDLSEAIARERADYFAQQKLWADALQEAFSVKNPSPELANFVEILPQKLCSSPTSLPGILPRESIRQ